MNGKWVFYCIHSCPHWIPMDPISLKTRMHSSRMRTVRCSGRLGGCLPGGCLPMECLPQGSPQEGGVCPGVYTPWTQKQTPPSPVNRITDRCKNITFPQLLLHMVNINFLKKSWSSNWQTTPHSRIHPLCELHLVNGLSKPAALYIKSQ